MKVREAERLCKSDIDAPGCSGRVWLVRPTKAMSQADALTRRPVMRKRHGWTYAFMAAAAGLALLPILVLVWLALSNGGGGTGKLVSTVLPRSALTTFQLLALVAALAGSIGVVCAWLVVEFDFPGKRWISLALVLPFAIPSYIAAYAFVEFFHFTGPAQTFVRAVFGFQSARDYWFPAVRSLPGAAIVMSLVLYPYVYLAARVSFLMQSRHAADVARSLGAPPHRVFWKILLPMARPAIAAGVSLALMEALNDLGAVEYLGVRTLTFSIYNTWLAQGSLGGAAQIACMTLLVVFVLLRLEQGERGHQRYFGGRNVSPLSPPRGRRLAGWRAMLAFAVCAAPAAAGFGIPASVLAGFAVKRLGQFADPLLHQALINSLTVAAAAALVTSGLALGIANAERIARSRAVKRLTSLALAGYSVPGTVLALGMLIALAAADNWVDAQMRLYAGVSTGLLLTGSAFGIVLASSIRFLALASGTIQAGIEKIPHSVDDAARSLGQTSAGSARRVLLPLLSPALLTAFVLVFVDTLKELSAAILLRPIGFNTLATFVYENASRAAVEDAAAASLVIVAAGLVPVALLSRMLLGENGGKKKRR